MTASVVCGGSHSGALTVEVHASGERVSVELERTVSITCEPPETENRGGAGRGQRG